MGRNKRTAWECEKGIRSQDRRSGKSVVAERSGERLPRSLAGLHERAIAEAVGNNTEQSGQCLEGARRASGRRRERAAPGRSGHRLPRSLEGPYARAIAAV